MKSVNQAFYDGNKHLRELKEKWIMAEKNNGFYANIRYGKLFVNGSILCENVW